MMPLRGLAWLGVAQKRMAWFSAAARVSPRQSGLALETSSIRKEKPLSTVSSVSHKAGQQAWERWLPSTRPVSGAAKAEALRQHTGPERAAALPGHGGETAGSRTKLHLTRHADRDVDCAPTHRTHPP